MKRLQAEIVFQSIRPVRPPPLVDCRPQCRQGLLLLTLQSVDLHIGNPMPTSANARCGPNVFQAAFEQQIRSFLLPVLNILLGALAVALGVVLIRTRRRMSMIQREIHRFKSPSGGLDRTLLALVGRAGSSIDVLNESKRILLWQGKRPQEETASDAIGLVSRLISTVMDATGIEPIEGYSSTVAFDPACHSSYEGLSPGEQALVLETGWRKDSNILKKAVVKRIAGAKNDVVA